MPHQVETINEEIENIKTTIQKFSRDEKYNYRKYNSVHGFNKHTCAGRTISKTKVRSTDIILSKKQENKLI
jgi:hypothetical protein